MCMVSQTNPTWEYEVNGTEWYDGWVWAFYSFHEQLSKGAYVFSFARVEGRLAWKEKLIVEKVGKGLKITDT